MSNTFSWLLLLGAFMLATNYAEKMALQTADKNKQYLAYGIYILAEALIFVPLLGIIIDFVPNSETLLTKAAIVTLSLFTGLSAVVFITKKDFSFLKSILTIGFFLAIGLIIAGAIFGFDLGLWFSVGMCVLAAGSILYQTSNLIHNYSNDQYIPAALGLFASLMLLFWYIIQIFLSRD
ncbi:Bax inhibitor-1/YccA family protein [Pseudofulvibacter geojedonensis]|uniref:Bax inhibitor-1 family protein n=1 Tax=Pseudofulvibacter geojedonensis TaxID=1123758 RepID=A0ABW3HZJ0_9FLAO